MRFTSADGIQYRAQFVHSAHDLKHPLPSHPGSLRQVVDDLARSLRRRVTLCEISEDVPVQVELSGGAEPEQGVQVTGRPLGYGFAVCHFWDQFVKAEGRRRSFFRALRASRLPREVKDGLTASLGYTEDDARDPESTSASW